ncbi:MAG: hypothetical protein FWC56_05615, partial [Phycisphaerae bacterium]|nr:hypothetical protein [Phycisphaerae bacterium]
MNNLNHQLEPHQNATSAFDSADDSVRTAEYVFGKADAKRSATLVQVIALAGMVACVAGAALLQAPINQQRKELQLVLSNDLYKELPPKYAWVSAAGGTFRGIAADVLWMRAEGLKQEGKYYELHQLAKWICTLQPRFPAVWVFQSWNMAYNISVGTHTVQERWQWVYNGIRLLRDEGIPNNDKTATLYYQLAWTFYHKVGAIMDDYQLYYKRIWATTMEVLLGSPSAGLSDEEQIDYYKPIAYAPRRLEELIAQHPGVAKLAEQLKSLGINVNDSSTSINNIFHPWEEQFFKPYTRWLQQQQYVALLKKPPTLDDHTQRFYEFLDNASPADLAALIAYMRATVLREQYKMDPMFMYELPRNLSKENPVPIDWRTPWAHSLYWGTYGATKGRQVNNAQTFDLLNNDRVALFSIGQMIRLGRYIFRPNLDQPEQSYLSMGPDFRYIELVHRRSLEIGQRYLDADEHGIQDTAGRTFKDFHINTLETSLVSLYLAGYEKEALKYFEYLVTYYTDPYTGEIRNPYLHKTFQEFMQANIVEVRSNQYDVILLLNSLLNRAYLALGN